MGCLKNLSQLVSFILKSFLKNFISEQTREFKVKMERQRPSKKRLSKNILEMKFMKKTKEKTEMEMEDEERQQMFRNQISDAMRHQGSRFIIDPSYASIEELNFGRIAFHGMNPEIEKMAENERIRQEEKEAAKNEKEVQDEDMAHF